MRKMMLLLAGSFILVLGTLLSVIFFNNSNKVKEFYLEDFDECIKEFPSDRVLGFTNSPKDAKKKAEAVWIEIYGKEVKGKKPYFVSYDFNHDIWLVEGRLPKNYIGGVPYILIRKSDGKVLAVWHDK